MSQLNLLGNAPLVNVGLCVAALEETIGRPDHLPRLMTFTGPSGFGKTTAATVAANKFNAVFVRASSSWTRKAAHLAILKDMGITPAKTLYGMAEQVAEELALAKVPLIIDECDYLVKSGSIEFVRDILDASSGTIMLIGEENMHTQLQKWERFSGRVSTCAQAEPASMDDTRALCAKYVDGVTIADDLLSKVHMEARGSVRRICVNLERIRREAMDNGLDRIDLDFWGSRPLFTGSAPTRRL
jgi:ATPase related to the helicase subunit of the Holliday junction resolvase